jgi:hypothetical protein
MTEYYKEQLEKGLMFQDFIADKLIESIGISLTSYSSIKNQKTKGENRQGFEIKFDNRFKDTGNIYIETAEKSNENNVSFVDSGIFRNDNSWLYLIGNYDEVYIFAKNILIHFFEINRYKKVETKTSKGFLLPKECADKFCCKKLTFNTPL